MMPVRPIRAIQIQAGATLRELLNPWNSTDNALTLLAIRFPDHTLEACLVKTATLNALYNTNVFAVWRMGEHVHRVLNEPGRSNGPDLVDRMAQMDANRAHRSFASKYAHFFIDPEAFPILDQYVVKMLAWHLGHRRVWPESYVEFHDWFNQLRPFCEGNPSTKEIDQYLWMAGMKREFDRSGRKYLSASVGDLFERTDTEASVALACLDSTADKD